MKYIKHYEYVVDNKELKKIKDLGILTLYHSITPERAIKALNENKLGGYTQQRTWAGGKRLKDDQTGYYESDYIRGLSTSRDIEYCAGWNNVVFIFDRDKIKNKYKILPYNWGYSIGGGYNQGSRVKREREEFIITGFNKGFKKDDSLKFMKMVSKPNGYIEPLDKYLIGFFISGRFDDLMKEEDLQILKSHPKYLGIYTDNDTRINKKLSLKDRIKNVFSKKLSESVEDEPNVGDYVKLYSEDIIDEIKDFLVHNIGQIIDINKELDFPYRIKFEHKIPTHDDYIMDFEINEIVEWSYDKETLKIKKDINKYNL